MDYHVAISYLVLQRKDLDTHVYLTSNSNRMYPLIGLSPEDPEWNEGSECWWMCYTTTPHFLRDHLHHLPHENSLFPLIILAFFLALLNALTPFCDHYWLHPKHNQLPPSLLFPKAWNCFFPYCFPTTSKSRFLSHPQEGCPCQTGQGLPSPLLPTSSCPWTYDKSVSSHNKPPAVTWSGGKQSKIMSLVDLTKILQCYSPHASKSFRVLPWDIFTLLYMSLEAGSSLLSNNTIYPMVGMIWIRISHWHLCWFPWVLDRCKSLWRKSPTIFVPVLLPHLQHRERVWQSGEGTDGKYFSDLGLSRSW